MSFRFAAQVLALWAALAAPESALAARNKAVAPEARCASAVLCTAACNAAGWCKVAVCRPSAGVAPTLAYCPAGSSLCPPKC